jgi:hypothetical protein
VSLADILMQLQDDDRYAGLGHLPERPQPSVPMIPPPSRPTPSSGTSGLMGLLPLIAAQRGGGGGGMGGGGSFPEHGTGPGPGGYSPGMMGAHNEALDIARWIENRPGTDFQVGALHGFQGTPEITSGHIENSQHYGLGFAGDVNYYGGRRFGDEDDALSWLYRRLNARYGDDLTELLWHVPEHYDHLHYGTRPGG